MKNLDIKSNTQSVFSDISGRKSLLVSFGGIQAGLGVPLFEFFNSISEIDCDKLFFRDFHQAWYQKGVNAQISTPYKIVNFLQKAITDYKYDRICFLGNSMGGYAAVLFGTMLKVDKVIAFAPQTYIDRKHRIITLDRRWRKQIGEIYKFKGKTPEFFDLHAHLKNHSDLKTHINIYYSTQYRLDKFHAERLKTFNNVKLHPRLEGGHNVVKDIRNKGELYTIVSTALL